VYGVSEQDTEYQREAADRLHLPFPLLSDDGLELAEALRLPRYEVAGQTLLNRLTLVIREGRIERVWYRYSLQTDMHRRSSRGCERTRRPNTAEPIRQRRGAMMPVNRPAARTPAKARPPTERRSLVLRGERVDGQD